MKMTKAAARKRLSESVKKISTVAASGHISFAVADSLVKNLNKQISRLK